MSFLRGSNVLHLGESAYRCSPITHSELPDLAFIECEGLQFANETDGFVLSTNNSFPEGHKVSTWAFPLHSFNCRLPLFYKGRVALEHPNKTELYVHLPIHAGFSGAPLFDGDSSVVIGMIRGLQGDDAIQMGAEKPRSASTGNALTALLLSYFFDVVEGRIEPSTE